MQPDNEEYLDSDGYPTAACLKKIEQWPFEDPKGWFEFIESVWSYNNHNWKEENLQCEISDRPVHHIFEVKTDE